MRKSRIVELASQILSQAETIDGLLASEDYPALSFNIDTASELPSATHDAQAALLEASDELQTLIQGPTQSLMLLTGYRHTAIESIHAIVRFGIARAVPVEQAIPFADVAQACDLSEEDVKRICRHAMTFRIFTELSPGFLSHTPISRLLAEDSNLLSWVDGYLDEYVPAATRMVDAMQRWPRSEEPNQAGFNIAHDEKDSIFQAYGRDSVRAKRFADAMKLYTETPAFSLDHLVKEFPWASVQKVVDLGGSQGHASIALARAFPHLHCIVQDLPGVLHGVEAPGDLRDQLTYAEHDIFASQPVKDADVFLLRWVLHDWSDLYAVKILRALIPVLKPSTRILINDSCLPDHGSVSLYQQRSVRTLDISMKVCQNARERDGEEWKMLLKLADDRYRLQEIVRPPGAALALIVAGWTSDSETAAE